VGQSGPMKAPIFLEGGACSSPRADTLADYTNPYISTVSFCVAPCRMPDFVQLQQQIEETLAKLKATQDPFLRREVLKEMRALLREADRLLGSNKAPNEGSK